MADLATPAKIVCVGLNYHDHATETGQEVPEWPLLFAKWPNTIIASGEEIVIPAASRRVDYEGELGLVIGKQARGVAEADAYDYVSGYFVANDVSARDVQHKDKQWVRGKSFDTFLPIGDVVPADSVEDPQDLPIRTILNGQTVQESNTSDMIFDIRKIVAFVTEAITLEPGDLILTGTPAGVGAFRDPRIWLGDGDEITVEVDGVGSVTNPVRSANGAGA
ncbi:MAG TPA: fumarylacetoacetate hydrolase family protein [Solirubrobacterales bacterium]|jgi:2-keto-4-pentenoate hydratase/2-oxohepta-3-ene-1,7-dioic acid hydratase in catechol pathway